MPFQLFGTHYNQAVQVDILVLSSNNSILHEMKPWPR